MSQLSESVSAVKTPCEENVDLFGSPLMEDFDSQTFKEDNPSLHGEHLEHALDAAEANHAILHKEAVKEAVELCHGCPILQLCAQRVMKFEEQTNASVYGVVAGMEPHERRKIRRRIARREAARKS